MGSGVARLDLVVGFRFDLLLVVGFYTSSDASNVGTPDFVV